MIDPIPGAVKKPPLISTISNERRAMGAPQFLRRKKHHFFRKIDRGVNWGGEWRKGKNFFPGTKAGGRAGIFCQRREDLSFLGKKRGTNTERGRKTIDIDLRRKLI